MEDTAYRLRDHSFFVGADDADGYAAARRGDHALIRQVSLFVELDPEKLQAIANPTLKNFGASEAPATAISRGWRRARPEKHRHTRVAGTLT